VMTSAAIGRRIVENAMREVVATAKG
jgi:hypothetical protein